jgi:hypothetical protein
MRRTCGVRFTWERPTARKGFDRKERRRAVIPITTLYEKSKEARSCLSARYGRDSGPVFEMLLLEEVHP